MREEAQIVVAGRLIERKTTGTNTKTLREELEEKISDVDEIKALTGSVGACYVKKGNVKNVSIKGVEWDTVTFGKYNGKDISWRVLNVSGDDAFVLALPFHLIRHIDVYDFHIPRQVFVRAVALADIGEATRRLPLFVGMA